MHKDISYLVNMYEHHKCISFAGGILFLFQESMDKFWCIRDQEIEVPEETKTEKKICNYCFLTFFKDTINENEKNTTVVTCRLCKWP